MEELATYMHEYTMRGQHTADRALTRYKHDLPVMVERNEISTGPGRYRIGVPHAYANGVFVPDPTIRQQRWGAAHDMSSTKTDVESDLWNLSRATTRMACGSWNPATAPQRILTPMPEASFPQTHARLVDPPSTLRATGWNRFEWLCQNPQENVMVPFEWFVNTKNSQKDGYQPYTAAEPFKEMDPAVPVARQPGSGDAPNFSNQIPGASQRFTESPPQLRATPRGGPMTGTMVDHAAPIGPVANPADRQRAVTGVEGPPPMWTSARIPGRQ